MDGEKQPKIITLVQNYFAVGITLLLNITYDFTFDAMNFTSQPILNTLECYSLIDTDQAIYSQDSKFPNRTCPSEVIIIIIVNV